MSISDAKEIKLLPKSNWGILGYNSAFSRLNTFANIPQSLFMNSPLGSLIFTLRENPTINNQNFTFPKQTMHFPTQTFNPNNINLTSGSSNITSTLNIWDTSFKPNQTLNGIGTEIFTPPPKISNISSEEPILGGNERITISNHYDNNSLSRYNASKGKKLASVAMHNAGYVIDASTKEITSERKDPDQFTHMCTRYVKAAIRDAGLGEYYNANSAYQMTSYLKNNDNFIEISANTPLNEIPAGCVLIYDRGVGGYSKEHGHIELKTDDGRAVSDGITDNLYKKPSHIFMPV